MVKKMTSKLDCDRSRQAESEEEGQNSPANSYSSNEDSPKPKQLRRRSRRQIAKAKRGRKEVKNTRKGKRGQKATPDKQQIDVFNCEKHPGNRIEFICTYPRNIKEMCSYCILDHKNFINDIHLISHVVEQYKAKLDRESIPQIQEKIVETQGHSIGRLEETCTKIRERVNQVINNFKENLISDDHQLADSINNIREFKNHFVDNADALANKLKNNTIDKKSLVILKKFMQDKRVERCNEFVIETDLLLEQVENALENNITYVQDACVVNSTGEGVGKFLHWFEWEKRDLHLFDVTRCTHRIVKLVIPFKIYPFSRSIITPNGLIYLLGGEDKIEGAKKETYCFNVATVDTDKTLHSKPPMPHKKYDFTLCYMNGYIYVICGKNVDNEIVATCEKFKLETETWSSCNNVNVRRYAASAATIKERNKIYLFGGRGEAQNAMINEIEEYCTESDIWRVLDLNWPHNWKPVEVCATIQLKRNEIIIFGGSDVNVEDSKDTYIFKAKECKLVKVDDLKKPHVFVSAPFIYGNYVFAVGNEYYVKTRNIHRFDIKRNKWEIIF